MQDKGAGYLQPVHYLSKRFTQPEENYLPYERELLAVLTAVRTWRPYLFGNPFTIYTDHKPLETLLTKSKETNKDRHLRWIGELMDYSANIKHMAGQSELISLPDAISRRPDYLPKLAAADQQVTKVLNALRRSGRTTQQPRLFDFNVCLLYTSPSPRD